MLLIIYSFSVFVFVGSQYTPRDVLKVWKDRNQRWLSVSEVHRETTAGVRVTVLPLYMGSREEQDDITYWWRWVESNRGCM